MSDYVQQEIQAAGSANFASVTAERAVIARMLMDSKEAELHAADLSEHDFTSPVFGSLFRAIQAVVANRMDVDYVTVDSALGSLFPGNHQALSDAMLDATSDLLTVGHRTEDYIRIVKELSIRRQSIRSFQGLVERLKDPTADITDIMEQARIESAEIQRGGHTWQSLQDVLVNTYDYLIKRQQGEIKAVTTGIDNIDNLIGGFFGGELTVIGARPAVGKSAFGANIAMAAARKGQRVAIVSREMTDIQYGSRIMARQGDVDGMKLRKGDINPDDWTHIANAMSDTAALPIEFMFTARSVEDVVAEATRKAQRGELDMLIVDYLQLMETRKQFQQENLRVGYISTTLKHLATDCNIPVIALAQVNRDSDGQMPTLRSLKASGDIEQDADGVIFLHRPSSANDPYVDPRDKQYFEGYEVMGLSYLCIYVAKQRQGATGKACVIFDPAHMRYMEIDRRRES